MSELLERLLNAEYCLFVVSYLSLKNKTKKKERRNESFDMFSH